VLGLDKLCCAQDGLLQSTFCYEVDSTDHGPGIKLTLHGKQRIMTVTEISQLSGHEFNAIWSVGHFYTFSLSPAHILLHPVNAQRYTLVKYVLH